MEGGFGAGKVEEYLLPRLGGLGGFADVAEVAEYGQGLVAVVRGHARDRLLDRRLRVRQVGLDELAEALEVGE